MEADVVRYWISVIRNQQQRQHYIYIQLTKNILLLHKSFTRRTFFINGDGHCNHLRPKAMVNRGLTEAVALPASVNQLTEAGTLIPMLRVIWYR
jgi:hypothetical protein